MHHMNKRHGVNSLFLTFDPGKPFGDFRENTFKLSLTHIDFSSIIKKIMFDIKIR